MTTTAEFWRLLGESRLVAPGLIQQKQQAFGQMKGAATSDSSRTLAEWLISEGVITRYQAKLLRAGRSGPFYYGDYKLHDRYESGRLAGEFSAVHVPSGHPVILHFLTGPMTENPKLWSSVAQQYEQLRGNSHPHVLRVNELIDLVSFKFAVLEHLQGESLQKVASSRPMPVPEACRIVRQVAIALSYLHGRKQTHGETRPRNVWLDSHGNAKLLTEPLSIKFMTAPGRFNLSLPDSDGRMVELADYLAPELARAGAQPNHLSDIYALGCTLYELLSGQPPFAGGTAAEKVQRHTNEAIRPLEKYGVPQPLLQVITYMMAKDPGLRFQQAGMLVDALAAYVDPQSLQTAGPQPLATQGVYENHLQQRRAAMAQVAAQPIAAPEVNFSFASGSQSATSSARTAGPNETLAFDSVAGSSASSSTLADRHKRTKGPSNQALAGYFAAGVVAIVALVLLGQSLTGPSDDTVDSQVAQDSSGVESPGGNSRSQGGAKASGSTASGNTTDGTSNSGGETASADDQSAPTTNKIMAQETIVPDDGELLWASPTSGAPPDLSYLPNGSQIFLLLRPAELVAHEEGDKILAALGPYGVSYAQWVERTTGFAPMDIEQVLVGIWVGDKGVENSLVVRLRESATQEQLLATWNSPSGKSYQDQAYYNGAGYSYYIPPESKGKVFAVTPTGTVRELIDQDGAPPLLSRDMENMFAGADTRRHFTLVFSPHYLFGDGQKLFDGPGEVLRKPLYMFLGDDEIKAVQLSMQLDERLFVELRVRGAIDIPPRDLAERFQQRMAETPSKIEAYIATINAQPYARQVLYRFPGMIRFLNRNTRIGSGMEHAILRTYQPDIAAHNLLMGIELTLAHQGGGPVVIASGVGGASDNGDTVADRLKRTTSLSFPRDTLEMSLQMLSEEIGVEIVILGNDLKLDGITKNQSFGIDIKDQPAQKILEKILFLANPDKTVADISDPNQKLVYVVKPSESEGKETIFVTTRSEAEKRGDELPAAFVTKPDPK